MAVGKRVKIGDSRPGGNGFPGLEQEPANLSRRVEGGGWNGGGRAWNRLTGSERGFFRPLMMIVHSRIDGAGR